MKHHASGGPQPTLFVASAAMANGFIDSNNNNNNKMKKKKDRRENG